MPPEPKGRRRPDEARPPYFQQKAVPGGRHNQFSSDYESPDMFSESGSSNHGSFPMNYSRNLHQQQQRNNVPAASALSDPIWEWHEGDKCMAKYWEDNRVRILTQNNLPKIFKEKYN